jgi:hypothetical protein
MGFMSMVPVTFPAQQTAAIDNAQQKKKMVASELTRADCGMKMFSYFKDRKRR